MSAAGYHDYNSRVDGASRNKTLDQPTGALFGVSEHDKKKQDMKAYQKELKEQVKPATDRQLTQLQMIWKRDSKNGYL